MAHEYTATIRRSCEGDFAKGCYSPAMEGEPNLWITRVDLYPEIEWDCHTPSAGALVELHHKAHENALSRTR